MSNAMRHLKGYVYCSFVFVCFQFVSKLQAQNPNDLKKSILEITDRITEPYIPSFLVTVTSKGAVGNGLKNCKPAFDRAMNACKRKGGGTIRVPKGLYILNGPIHFVSNVNLHLEEGAVLRFSDNALYYLPLVLTSWEGTMLYNYSPLIYGYNVTNISITGPGVIDGEGSKNWSTWKSKENADKALSRKMNHEETRVTERNFGKGHFLRPQMIQFVASNTILLEDVRIEDAPFWCVHLLKSSNITIRGISYDAYNKNNDGIDLEYADNVLIENVVFNNGDDNVVIKAGRDHEGRSNASTPSKNIVVRNCTFKGLHAVVIGSEMAAGVQNVYVTDCKASGYLKRGIYFKTNSDRGGYIKNITINNITFKAVEDAIFMTSNYHNEGSGLYPSKISDITLSNISCSSVSKTAIVIEGYAKSKVENVFLNGISIPSAKNAITTRHTNNIRLNNLIIGAAAGIPTSVK